MEAVPGSQWLLVEETRDDAPVRLFCFPGNDVHEYEGWSAALSVDLVECYAVHAPTALEAPTLDPAGVIMETLTGKGGAVARAGADADGGAGGDARRVLGSLVNEVLLHMDKPFIFFGRSLGAHVAAALALELESRGLPQPKRLFVAAPEPFLPSLSPPGNGEGGGGSGGGVGSKGGGARPAADAELLDGMRAILAAAPTAAPALTCPITVLLGANRFAGGGVDGSAGENDGGWGGSGSEEAAASWAAATSGALSVIAVPGAATAAEQSSSGGGKAAAAAGVAASALLGRLEEVLREDVRQSREESTALIERWNSGTFAYPADKCLHHLFVESAAAFPDATAVVYPNGGGGSGRTVTLTFAELDAMTDRLACWLHAAGVRIGTTVGIFMEHCPEYAVAYIAAHKAGGAYMPIETVYPEELLRRVCEDARPVVVLTKRHFAARLPPWQPALCMDDDESDESGGANGRVSGSDSSSAAAESTLRNDAANGAASAANGHAAEKGTANGFGVSVAGAGGGGWRAAAAAAPPLPADRRLPTPDDLAYVVMSSGTTGAPKGICCPHRGAVHSYYYRLVTFPYEVGEREACHVFFVWELLRPLLGGLPEAGGTPVPLFVIPDDTIYHPQRLVAFLEEHAITRVLFTPSLLQLVLDTLPADAICSKLHRLRIVWLCGEVVTAELRNRFVDVLPGCRLENLYSISECHDISYANLNALDTRESPRYAPCGKVIPNVRAYVLDEDLRPVPVGVPGRMYIAGPCLALGYLNMPDKTAERFVPCPFYSSGADEDNARAAENAVGNGGDGGSGGSSCCDSDGFSGSRSVVSGCSGEVGRWMYDTGDRCRYLPSGSIEVLGRCDFMVKIRGYSVVVGAVEAAIAEHPLVSTACVLTEGSEGSADKRLVAYVVPERWEAVPGVQSVQAFLKARLPPYAVPSAFVLLDAIPINMASGKLDRRRLPASASAGARLMPVSGFGDASAFDAFSAAPGGDAAVTAGNGVAVNGGAVTASAVVSEAAAGVVASARPATATELRLAKLWASLLKVEEGAVRRGDDFFDLGGHSLLIVRLASAVAAHPAMGGVDLAIPDILERPTLAVLASHIDAVAAGRATPVPGDLSRPLLGLAHDKFQALACEVDAIIHNGAEVNLVRSYHSLKAANVLGTQEVLRLAVTNGFSTRIKPVHYVSTNGVFPLPSTTAAVEYAVSAAAAADDSGASGSGKCGVTSADGKGGNAASSGGKSGADDDRPVWAEDADLSELWRGLPDGYAQSKWVAERFCLEARARGLPVSVLRPGNLAPSSQTGLWNDSDFYHLVLAGCVAVGATPDCPEWRVDMTPVDFAAAAVVAVSVVEPSTALGRVLHVQNPRAPVPFAEVAAWVAAALGVALPPVPLAEFRRRITAAAAAEAEAAAAVAGAAVANGVKGGYNGGGGIDVLARLAAGLDSFAQYLAEMGTMDTAVLRAALESAGGGVKCPAVDAALLVTYSRGLAAAAGIVLPPPLASSMSLAA